MKNPLKVAIIGSGRLGRAVIALAAQDPSIQITAALSRSSERLHLDCDLFLDVSLPSALALNLETAVSYHKPIAIGTTGLSADDRALLTEASREIPLFYTPNFSLGMALLRKLALQAAPLLKSSHIDLVETHHAEKKDAPSGSALALAESIAPFRDAPGAPPVQIHSLRSGAVIGEHTLYFNTPEERLTIAHEAHSRDAFARGALAALHFLRDRPPGLYGMDDLLQGRRNENDFLNTFSL